MKKKYYKLFDTFLGNVFFHHQYRIRSFVRSIAQEVDSTETILDLGAGDCSYKPLFAQANYIACDIIESPELDFVCDVCAVPLDSGVIDKIISIQTLEHFPEPQLALKEMHRLLKKTGILYFSTNMATDLHIEPYDYYRYTKYGLKYLVERVGFEVISIKPHGGRGVLIAREILRLFTSNNAHPLIKYLLLGTFIIPIFITIAFLRLIDVVLRDESHTINLDCVCKKN